MKIGIIVAILLLIFIFEGISFAKKFIAISSKWKGYRVIRYKLQNKEYKFLVADTQEKWTKGLMYVRDLDNLDGMIFMFPKSQIQSFWNENTLMDLDIFWINNGKVVGTAFLPSIEKSKNKVIINSPKPVDTVVELVRKSGKKSFLN